MRLSPKELVAGLSAIAGLATVGLWYASLAPTVIEPAQVEYADPFRMPFTFKNDTYVTLYGVGAKCVMDGEFEGPVYWRRMTAHDLNTMVGDIGPGDSRLFLCRVRPVGAHATPNIELPGRIIHLALRLDVSYAPPLWPSSYSWTTRVPLALVHDALGVHWRRGIPLGPTPSPVDLRRLIFGPFDATISPSQSPAP